MSFSSTLLHARKSRANSEISELLTRAKDGHHRLDVVSKRCGARGRGKRERHGWLAADSFQTVPERPSVAAWALVYPRVGDGARRQPGSWFVSRKIGEVNYIPRWSYGPTFGPIGIRPIIRNKFRAFGHPYSWPAGDNSRRRFLS
ncbi:hypothetical protein EVAR_75016_1 [Eumeta japonica]|uniref:Uncharacterized protein n=1 Tax=Eumeta variegata TaxID=151549 RepID=A0A4C1VA96_EUMVA|nr:hypothetical protein EVAR_75016_1 [Eumeta japonica]